MVTMVYADGTERLIGPAEWRLMERFNLVEYLDEKKIVQMFCRL